MKRSKKIILITVSVILTFVLIINPIASVIIYEAIFSSRYQTAEWLRFYTDDFDSLTVEQVEIYEGDDVLAGYKYDNPTVADKLGVVVLAHGLGGGGHNAYMPLIDHFTDNGYYVFTYDATGNDNSLGDDVNGLPQGVIDLDRAIKAVYADAQYKDMPLFLVGHSWGAYSVGAVLNLHPEVRGAVMFSGFDRSSDMIKAGAADYVGSVVADIASPCALLYERAKFGDFASLSVSDGIAQTDAKIMVVHSSDDTTVPREIGYDKYYDLYKADTRVTFLLYEDRGHNYLYYSDAAAEYRSEINAAYVDYVEGNGLEYSAETKIDFFGENLDKSKCYELDEALMQQILAMFAEALK